MDTAEAREKIEKFQALLEPWGAEGDKRKARIRERLDALKQEHQDLLLQLAEAPMAFAVAVMTGEDCEPTSPGIEAKIDLTERAMAELAEGAKALENWSQGRYEVMGWIQNANTNLEAHTKANEQLKAAEDLLKIYEGDVALESRVAGARHRVRELEQRISLALVMCSDNVKNAVQTGLLPNK